MGAEILCVCSGGFHKSVRSRGRAFRKIWPVLLALQPDHGILVKRNRNQLCDYIMTTEPARLAGIPVLRSRDAEIPGGNFSSNLVDRPITEGGGSLPTFYEANI